VWRYTLLIKTIQRSAMKRAVLRISRTFLTGLLAMLPVAATLLVCAWVVGLILNWMGPNSLMGRVLRQIGFGIGDSAILGYALGLGVFVAFVLLLGWLVESNLQRGLASLVDGLMRRIPLVRHVYDWIQKFTHLLTDRKDEKARTLKPVWCHFGGIGGTVALGLLSAPEPFNIGEHLYYAVLIPTAPVPVGGGLLYLPIDWVKPADIGIDAVTSIYVSMGVTSGQYLHKSRVSDTADQ
jgi:uncharacterized membrane protein